MHLQYPCDPLFLLMIGVHARNLFHLFGRGCRHGIGSTHTKGTFCVQVECVKALLEAGANTKVFAMDDMNAMHFAAQKGHVEVVRQLLNAGEAIQLTTLSCTSMHRVLPPRAAAAEKVLLL